MPQKLPITLSSVVATVALGLVATAGGPGLAHAATITDGPSTLRYVAAAGETNSLTLTTEGRTLVLVDPGAGPATSLPATCRQDPAATTLSVRCETPGDWTVRVSLGDGDDRLTAETLPRRFALRVDTGEGENVVLGGDGDDQIVGGGGRDTLYGGYGDDVVRGGDGDNYVRGNAGDDDVRGGSGLDFVIGDGGDDVLRGGGGIDFISAGGGNDVASGDADTDNLDLGAGDDVGYGETGTDALTGGPGADRLYGGAGDDELRARDGEADALDCGGGADVARVDAGALDAASATCERVREPAAED